MDQSLSKEAHSLATNCVMVLLCRNRRFMFLCTCNISTEAACDSYRNRVHTQSNSEVEESEKDRSCDLV